METILHGGARRLPTRLCNAAAAPLHFSWYEVAPGDRCGRHVHAGKTETWLIVQGEGVVVVDGAEFPVGPGDALVTRPGQPHELRNTGAAALVFVNLVTPTGDGPITTTELEGP